MAPLSEEQAAEILWKYVEALKSAEDPETVSFVAVTSAAMDEIAPLMQTAALAARSLHDEQGSEASKDAVRAKFRARVAQMASEAATASAAAASPRGWRREAWWERFRVSGFVGGLGWACAVALAGFVAIARPASLPTKEPPAIHQSEPSHSEVHAAVPDLIHNKVPADRARALWAHLLWCEGCFGVYRTELGAAQAAAQTPVRQGDAMSLALQGAGLSLPQAVLPTRARTAAHPDLGGAVW